MGTASNVFGAEGGLMRPWAGVACLLAMTAPAAAECNLMQSAVLPFTLSHGKLLVQGRINDIPAELIFDTGAQTTILTESAVRHLDLQPVRGEDRGAGTLGTAEGINGGVTVRAVEARTIDLGGLRARNYAFFAMARNLTLGDTPIDGLLSADLLAKYDIDLDFPGQRIRLFYPQGDCSHPSVFLHGNLVSVPMQPRAGDESPRIAVSVGGRKLTAIVDTGAYRSVITEQAASDLGVVADARTAHMIGGLGAQRLSSRVAILPSLGIGDLELKNWKTDVAGAHLSGTDQHADMLLGLDVLMKLHPWISYSSHSFVFQYPPLPSPGD